MILILHVDAQRLYDVVARANARIARKGQLIELVIDTEAKAVAVKPHKGVREFVVVQG